MHQLQSTERDKFTPGKGQRHRDFFQCLETLQKLGEVKRMRSREKK
jgi:hypothetical protein